LVRQAMSLFSKGTVAGILHQVDICLPKRIGA
jgi:hypothetical protein